MMRDHMISNSPKQQLDCKFYCLIHSLRMEIRSYKAKRENKKYSQTVLLLGQLKVYWDDTCGFDV